MEDLKSKIKELENVILSALSDLKIDGHTQRGVYNAIAVLEKSAKPHLSKESEKEDMLDNIMDDLPCESKDFSKIYNAVEYTINKIYK